MKAAAFSYVRPDSLEQALEALAQYGPDARILAGGQSLMPMMALRVAQPVVLVDIGRIESLRGISESNGSIRVGALTRHVDLLSSPLIASRVPLLPRALAHVAHAAIRNRGTLGGSLALADPAAELPACALALDAEMVLAGASGERVVAAQDFFHGLYTTAIGDGEILVEIRFPEADPRERVFFDEVSRRRGDYAIAGLAATALPGARVRFAYLGCGDRPLRAPHAEQLAMTALFSGRTFDRSAWRDALHQDLDPPSDLQADADTREHLASVLAERACVALRSAFA